MALIWRERMAFESRIAIFYKSWAWSLKCKIGYIDLLLHLLAIFAFHFLNSKNTLLNEVLLKCGHNAKVFEYMFLISACVCSFFVVIWVDIVMGCTYLQLFMDRDILSISHLDNCSFELLIKMFILSSWREKFLYLLLYNLNFVILDSLAFKYGLRFCWCSFLFAWLILVFLHAKAWHFP